MPPFRNTVNHERLCSPKQPAISRGYHFCLNLHLAISLHRFSDLISHFCPKSMAKTPLFSVLHYFIPFLPIPARLHVLASSDRRKKFGRTGMEQMTRTHSTEELKRNFIQLGLLGILLELSALLVSPFLFFFFNLLSHLLFCIPSPPNPLP